MSDPILASDAERERAITLLRDAVGEGRLTLEEFGARVELAHAARTDAELAELRRDLPAAPAAAGTGAAGAGVPMSTTEQHRAVCSHLIRTGRWSLPARSDWRSIFGTVDLDLRQAQLAAADSELSIYNLFGTVTVIVPETVEVIVRGGGLFASQKIQAPATPPAPGAPRLTIDVRGPGGTLHVRTRPALGASIREAIAGRLASPPRDDTSST